MPFSFSPVLFYLYYSVLWGISQIWFILQIDSIKNIRNTIDHYEPLIIKFKTFGLQKLEAALKLLKETHDSSIIAKYEDYDISKIRDTNYNKDSKKIFEMFMETIK